MANKLQKKCPGCRRFVRQVDEDCPHCGATNIDGETSTIDPRAAETVRNQRRKNAGKKQETKEATTTAAQPEPEPEPVATGNGTDTIAVEFGQTAGIWDGWL